MATKGDGQKVPAVLRRERLDEAIVAGRSVTDAAEIGVSSECQRDAGRGRYSDDAGGAVPRSRPSTGPC